MHLKQYLTNIGSNSHCGLNYLDNCLVLQKYSNHSNVTSGEWVNSNVLLLDSCIHMNTYEQLHPTQFLHVLDQL